MQSPPKGPFLFKGKGATDDWRLKTLRGYFEQCSDSLAEIEQAMRKLVDEFEQTFSSPIAAYLVLHNTGNGKYIRWRQWGSKQRYFALCDNEQGEQFITSLSPPVRQVVFDYEQQRIRLNLLHGIYHYQTQRLKQFLSEQKALNRLRRETAN